MMYLIISLLLGGEVDHVGFVEGSYIQWHMIFAFSNSYDVFLSILFKPYA